MAKTATEELLSRVPLLAGVSKKDIREISGLMTPIDLPAGRELIHQGAGGNEFLIVLAGTAEVSVDGTVVAVCGAGDFFGEVALLEDRPRNATVTAKTDITVEVISRGEFAAFIRRRPDVDQQIRAAAADRHGQD
jgi:CRP-like cAMP-binding protein